MRAVAALAVASIAALLGAMTYGLPDAPSQARETLTWRQMEILHVRALTHACTDALGRPRFRVEQRIIVGGPAYRRWVLELWRKRAAFYCNAARQHAKVDTTVSRMIAAAEQVKREQGSGDPWPNCPDPYDGGGYSWQDTKDCESPGYGWGVDPPGYYCGPLQIDPVLWAHVIARWDVPC